MITIFVVNRNIEYFGLPVYLDVSLVIFDRKFISKDEWMNLSDQYGNRMKQITKYPEIFGNLEEANLYVIYN